MAFHIENNEKINEPENGGRVKGGAAFLYTFATTPERNEIFLTLAG